MKKIWWKLRYTLVMVHLTGMNPFNAWGFAGSWITSFDIDECTPSEAVAEELSCWGDGNL